MSRLDTKTQLVGLPCINRGIGFESYGSTDENIAYQTPLTSEASLGTIGDTQSGTQVFSADGVDINGSNGIELDLINNLSDYLNLYTEGNISFEIDTAYIDENNTVASVEYIFSKRKTGVGTKRGWLEKLTTGLLQLRWEGLSESTVHPVRVWPYGKDDVTRIELNWDSNVMEFYVDDLLMWEYKDRPANVSGAQSVDYFYLGSDIDNTSQVETGTNIKNFQMSFHKRLFTTDGETKSILFLGDSQIQQNSFDEGMGFSATKATVNRYNPGWGYTNLTTPRTNSNSSNRDTGILPTIFRDLSKRGVWTRDNNNYSVGGSYVADVIDYYNLSVTNGVSATHIVCGTGTNNVTNLTTATDFRADIRALVTSLESAGVENIVFMNIPTPTNNTSYASTTYQDKCDELNAEIAALSAWAASSNYSITIEVADVFSALGGHSAPEAYFVEADNLHIGRAGSVICGNTISALL